MAVLNMFGRKYKSSSLRMVFLILCASFTLLSFIKMPQRVFFESCAEGPKTLSASGTYAAAAVAANDGLCSEIGRNAMIRGGNAVDAAIAVLFCTGVSSPQSSGIGGGLFMTIYNSSMNGCVVIDGRETAPSMANSSMFDGALTIGVPGWLHALWTAHQGYGRAPWSQIVQPTVDLLRNGVPVSDVLIMALNGIGNRNDVNTWFTNPATGQAYKESEIYRNDRFAGLMQQIADSDDPIRLFYDSNMTDSFVKDIQAGGGILTRQDMSKYRSKVRVDDVLYSDLSEVKLRVCGPPPPAGAAFAMGIINTMRGFNDSRDNVDFYHRIIESFKFVYARRTESGDTDFVPEAFQTARDVVSDGFAKSIRGRMKDVAQSLSAYGGMHSMAQDRGTSQISIIDAEGNAVSVTASVNSRFGCGHASSDFGFMWNNVMDDFSIRGRDNHFGLSPSPNNFIAPGKRPQSSMSPIIAFDSKNKQARLAIGGVGGSRIISATALVTSRVLYLNDTLQYAIDAPRVHNQLLPFQTKFEKEFDKEIVRGLSMRGQDMIDHNSSNYVNAVYRNPIQHELTAVSDYRKGRIAFPAGF